jgi:aerobic-type carbon monoxide dehydrogenase small subunit (CoxS/CutS family)
MSSSIELMINGTIQRVETEPARPLLDVLREDLGLTGCKIGCGEGECGACTVLVDSQPTRACITAVGDAVGLPILTIEGLASSADDDRRSTIDDRQSASGNPSSTASPEGSRRVHRPSSPEGLHPLQQAFLDADAMQCGYCTPGMVMTALGLLLKNPHPTEQAIVEAMNGNICRCGAYARIVRAIQQAAAQGGAS